MSMTVNSNTVTVNIADILPALATMLDSREMSRYNSATPVQRDTYFNYADAVGKNNSPFAGWDSCVDYDLMTRGSFSVDSITGNVAADTVSNGEVTLKFTSYEPLLLSPLIWGNPCTNNQGMYGITNLTFLFNVGSANRVVRTAAPFGVGAAAGGILSVALASTGGQSGFDNATSLYLNYLTPHPSDLLPSKNCVGYYDLPRYISGGQPTIPAAVVDATGNYTTINNKIFTSQSLQLNQIPDKLIIFVRPAPSSVTNAVSDHFYPITNITVNWNNQSGLLSSFSQYDIWRASVNSGSNLSYNEFAGRATLAPTSFVGQGAANCGKIVPLCGSVLALDMAYTIQLTDDFLAPGSIGAYNLQFAVTVENWSTVDVIGAELVLITMNSGLMVLEAGASSVFVAILNKSDVLDASEGEGVSHSMYQRQVGGGFLDSLKSIGKALLPIGRALAPLAREAMSQSGNKYVKGADSVLKMVGLGHSGGGPSGGALRRKIH
jgi:hypothetical protein